MDRNDVRVAKPTQRAGFPGEPLGEARVRCRLGRQDLQSHHAVEGGLARLIHRPHAAFAEEAEDLKLREEPGHLLDARRHERFGVGPSGRVGGGALLEQASRAKPRQRARWQRGAALRAFLWHHPIHSGFIHTPTSEAKPSKCYRNQRRTCQQARAASSFTLRRRDKLSPPTVQKGQLSGSFPNCRRLASRQLVVMLRTSDSLTTEHPSAFKRQRAHNQPLEIWMKTLLRRRF